MRPVCPARNFDLLVTLFLQARSSDCAYCGRPIEPRNAWRGVTGHFFYGEFCADSEIETFAPPPNAPAHDELDINGGACVGRFIANDFN
jgi:hypothetical protein